MQMPTELLRMVLTREWQDLEKALSERNALQPLMSVVHQDENPLKQLKLYAVRFQSVSSPLSLLITFVPALLCTYSFHAANCRLWKKPAVCRAKVGLLKILQACFTI